MADPVRLSVEAMLFGIGPFAAGGMLLWGLIALLPILLHLLRRRRSRTVPWGAMQFLQAAVARRAKQFQFWRLLLLCLRVAAVLVIAAALARPLLKAPASGADDSRTPPTLRVLVLDTSYSMGTVGQAGGQTDGPITAGDRSWFRSAQEAAVEVCRSAARGDGFLLLTMSDPPRSIIQSVSDRADQTIAEIRRLNSSQGRADLLATLAAVEAAIGDAVRDGWTGPVDVILFSDLQQSTWETLPASPPRHPAGQGRAAAPLRYLVWDAAERLTGDNATVGPIQRDPSETGSGDSVAWLSPVTHTGGAAIRERLAQLLVDGHVEQSQSFDLQSDGSRTLLWSTRLSPGRHGIEVRIGEDALAADNVSRIVAEVSPKISVAAFGPTPSETRYFALAAAPGGAGSIEVRSFPLHQLPQTEIGRFDVWVFCDPTPLRDAAAERMRQHVGQGGGVVWWLGPNWQSGRGDNTVTTNTAVTDAEPLEPGSWTAMEATAADSQRIDPLGYESGFVQPFEAFPGAGLLSLPVFRYWRLELGSGWQPAVAIGDGDPLVASYSAAGGGRQVLVATPPGPGSSTGARQSADAASAEPWNALIAWPSFVPLVQEIIRWVEAGEQGSSNFVVGQAVAGQTPETELGEKLRNESGATLDVAVRSRSGQSVQWTAGVVDRAGFYYWSEANPPTDASATKGGLAEGRPVIAVNVDPAEGRLQKIAALPPPWILYDQAVQQAPDPLGSEPSAILRAAGLGERELFWWFLLAAAGLLAAESLVVKLLEGRF